MYTQCTHVHTFVNGEVAMFQVQCYLHENSRYEKCQVIDLVTGRLLQRVCHHRIKKIEANLSRCNVHLEIRGEGDLMVVEITGNKTGIPLAQKEVQDLIQSVIYKEHQITGPGRLPHLSDNSTV